MPNRRSPSQPGAVAPPGFWHSKDQPGRRAEILILDGAAANGSDRRAVHTLIDRLRRAGMAVVVLGEDAGGGWDGEIDRARVAELLRERGEPWTDILLHRDGESPARQILEDQIHRRELGELPSIELDATWTLTVDGFEERLESVHETLLTQADGRIGTNGSPLSIHAAAHPEVLAAGIYDGSGPETHLLPAPIWHRIGYSLRPSDRLRRTLDLRDGLLHEELEAEGVRYRSVRFSSLTRPGLTVLRVVVSGSALRSGIEIILPAEVESGGVGGTVGEPRWAVVTGTNGAIAVVSMQASRRRGRGRVLDRVSAYDTSRRDPRLSRAAAQNRSATQRGFDRLLAEQRGAWAKRWAVSDVIIEGDARLQHAVRFALFHLMSTVTDRDEAAVGARGLSGPAYRGHVFWDSDVFVLPFLAATHPPSARAMLEYRIRRLPASRESARRMGRDGARFAWESAATGEDVTPTSMRDWSGKVVPIRTGRLEEHIVADVAWAAFHYVAWTGDWAFLEGPGQPLLVDTARYWASRVRFDRIGRAHIYGVIGPDEYHEGVDDNAFTNVMARWNLRRAADLAGPDVGGFERLHWREVADALVDGYDRKTGLYEEFSGFFDLEPVIVTELAPRRPVSGEALLGRERLRRSQVVKQADVLMLHHLVPEETAPKSLIPNLDFYEPRTAHGSSLSPGIHAGLFARAGRFEEALEILDIAARMDLDDLSGTSDGGLHMATMGSVWQALVFGFAGIRPAGDGLRIDPRIPKDWDALEIRLQFRGTPVVVRMDARSTRVRSDGPLTVHFGREKPVRVGRSPVRLIPPGGGKP